MRISGFLLASGVPCDFSVAPESASQLSAIVSTNRGPIWVLTRDSSCSHDSETRNAEQLTPTRASPQNYSAMPRGNGMALRFGGRQAFFPHGHRRITPRHGVLPDEGVLLYALMPHLVPASPVDKKQDAHDEQRHEQIILSDHDALLSRHPLPNNIYAIAKEFSAQ